MKCTKQFLLILPRLFAILSLSISSSLLVYPCNVHFHFIKCHLCISYRKLIWLDRKLASQYFRLKLLKCFGVYSKSSDSKLEVVQSERERVCVCLCVCVCVCVCVWCVCVCVCVWVWERECLCEWEFVWDSQGGRMTCTHCLECCLEGNRFIFIQRLVIKRVWQP